MSGLRQHQTPAALHPSSPTRRRKAEKQEPHVSRHHQSGSRTVVRRLRRCHPSPRSSAQPCARLSTGRHQRKAVYDRHCLTCHGAGGWGDGPDAATLGVPPPIFTGSKSFLKSDEELLRTIEHGIVFSPMHSWQGQLTETEDKTHSPISGCSCNRDNNGSGTPTSQRAP